MGYYRARTIHLESTVNHVVDNFLDPCSFFGIFLVMHNSSVEVAVANMTEDTGKEAQIR